MFQYRPFGGIQYYKTMTIEELVNYLRTFERDLPVLMTYEGVYTTVDTNQCSMVDRSVQLGEGKPFNQHTFLVINAE